jgi:uncharacterized membrane protein YkoI
MKRSIKWITAGAIVLTAAATGTGIAMAAGANEKDVPITGDALDRASEAALAETGGGRVSGTEVGDEESYYEVEVTLEDGQQVDVQLDEGFNVVGSKTDREDPASS